MAVFFKITQIVFDGRCTSMSVLLLYQVALWLLALVRNKIIFNMIYTLYPLAEPADVTSHYLEPK